jgi:hypothetical protein
MTGPGDIPQHFKQIVGSLPLAGQLLNDGISPFEAIDPVRDGFVERFDHYYADMLAVLNHLEIRQLAVIGISSVAMAATSEQMRHDWPGYLDKFFTIVFSPNRTRPSPMRTGCAIAGQRQARSSIGCVRDGSVKTCESMQCVSPHQRW